MTLTVGVDVGGTKIAAALVDPEGRVSELTRRESPAADVEAIEDTIGEMVEGLLQAAGSEDVEAVGAGAAGYIDADRSTVLFAPNLAWRDLDLGGQIQQRVGLPVVVENDANAAAWGEFRFGAGEDVDNLLLVTVGTGVGGGIVQDGRLLRGAFGVAAEVGHLRVEPGGRPCGCGNRGCLESYASGSALVREARAAFEAGSLLGRDLLDRAGGDPESISGPMITEAAAAGDPFAIEQYDELGRWLGEGLSSLAAVLDPRVIVIGGGVSSAGDLLLEPTRAAFRRHLTGRGHRPEADLRLATLGNTAGVVGAADLARQRV